MREMTLPSAQTAEKRVGLPSSSPSRAACDRTGFASTRQWQLRGEVLADLTSPNGAAPRRARLNISFGQIAQLHTPWAARFWESDAPPGVQPIEWLFGSKTSVSCLEDALALLDKTRGLVTTYAVT